MQRAKIRKVSSSAEVSGIPNTPLDSHQKEKVRDVKAIIESMVGFWCSEQHVLYDEKRLEDGKTLAFYNIRENSILDVWLEVPSFQIFVKDGNGKSLILNVHEHDMKNKIFSKADMLVDAHYLVFGGRTLEDDRGLASYSIKKLSTLQMRLHHTYQSPKKAMIQKLLKKPGEVVFQLPLQDHFSLADVLSGRIQ
ncbi:unnamed protein product [Camellia sinensis]